MGRSARSRNYGTTCNGDHNIHQETPSRSPLAGGSVLESGGTGGYKSSSSDQIGLPQGKKEGSGEEEKDTLRDQVRIEGREGEDSLSQEASRSKENRQRSRGELLEESPPRSEDKKFGSRGHPHQIMGHRSWKGLSHNRSPPPTGRENCSGNLGRTGGHRPYGFVQVGWQYAREALTGL